ncbi:hypothetical protein FNV43_RR14995 [Rhamnella rubrinervis]|uniref:RRP15-like protein n=1 Tax=Rhamnella rubrinervis TaxID=2594499 RepID=A0A8K0H410_9ROSA|nr:hypothetical protein FNV43_RR14995 [Rhamnella rubrinervis]
MATHLAQAEKGPKKRKLGIKKSSKAKSKARRMLAEKVRRFTPKTIDNKMKKLYHKRAREYNSDEDESSPATGAKVEDDLENDGGYSSEEAEEHGDHDGLDSNEGNGVSDDEEDDTIQPGITKFIEGCRAFGVAFKKIIKKTVQDDDLGPVLSGHKKLVAEKLAEEEAERKVKSEAKKEKHLVAEKGHVKLQKNFLDSHEKFLIGVATKGVVKLFNAVNKAQNAQKGLDPSRTRDAKVIKKRRKEAFFSELGKTRADGTAVKARTTSSQVDGEGPSWAPLRDNYMLTSSKLKDWDKKPDTIVAADELENVSVINSSEED